MVNVITQRPKNLPQSPRLPLLTSDDGTATLEQLEDGTVRFVGTRVSFDSVIAAYKQGRSPVQINDSFDVVSVLDIEKAIDYYRAEQKVVDEYLAVRKVAANIWREFNENRQRSPEWAAHIQQSRTEREQSA